LAPSDFTPPLPEEVKGEGLIKTRPVAELAGGRNLISFFAAPSRLLHDDTTDVGLLENDAQNTAVTPRNYLIYCWGRYCA
jgi:hypothetical protein